MKFAAGVSEDASELQIENERLKTTLMIISNKLKMKQDEQDEEMDKVMSKQKQLN